MQKDGQSTLNFVVDYLLNHYYNGVEIGDKKSVLRHLKVVWMLLNPMTPVTEIIATKKVKQTHQTVFPQTQIDPLLRDQVCNKIIEVTVKSAFQYSLQKTQTLDSMQTSKVV